MSDRAAKIRSEAREHVKVVGPSGRVMRLRPSTASGMLRNPGVRLATAEDEANQLRPGRAPAPAGPAPAPVPDDGGGDGDGQEVAGPDTGRQPTPAGADTGDQGQEAAGPDTGQRQAPAADAGKPKPDVPARPPASGKGSGVEAWRAYAAQVTGSPAESLAALSREDIISLLDAEGVGS